MAGNKIPIAVAASHCLRVGFGLPIKRTTTYKIMPAITKRKPAIKNGGKLSIPNLMAR